MKLLLLRDRDSPRTQPPGPTLPAPAYGDIDDFRPQERGCRRCCVTPTSSARFEVYATDPKIGRSPVRSRALTPESMMKRAMSGSTSIRGEPPGPGDICAIMDAKLILSSAAPPNQERQRQVKAMTAPLGGRRTRRGSRPCTLGHARSMLCIPHADHVWPPVTRGTG